jgi:pimeloyl-ACP methyl ester carboxylesterase
MTTNVSESTSTNQPVAGKYAPVNGLKLYYEIFGSGQPLVVLHGGVGASEMFGVNLATLAESRQVIAVHLQAHGRTADIDRPHSFEAMSDDIAALLKYLAIKQADLLGYSLGGGVALQTAIRHPDVLRKLVLVSTPFKRTGFYSEVLEGMAKIGPESAKYMSQSPLSQLYPGLNWAQLFTKIGDLLRQDYDWSKAVAAIKLPMMIVFADADSVSMTHILEFFSLLGGGLRDAGMDGSLRPVARLAILPGLTHYDICMSRALATTVSQFLDASIPVSK